MGRPAPRTRDIVQVNRAAKCTESGLTHGRLEGVITTFVEGDLLDQNVDAIVNAWNRNVLPWWLLLPQGVSRAIKRRAGTAPFDELRRHGFLPLGGAVLTGAGRLPFRGIIHVAGIGLSWRASQESVMASVRNAIRLAGAAGFRSLAFPLIGSGTGGMRPEQVQDWMLEALCAVPFDGEVRIVRYRAVTGEERAS